MLLSSDEASEGGDDAGSEATSGPVDEIPALPQLSADAQRKRTAYQRDRQLRARAVGTEEEQDAAIARYNAKLKKKRRRSR